MRALVNIPPSANPGEVIEIKALVSHPMETGYRTGADGLLVPRDIINRFTCSFNGEDIFNADLFPAIAANPFFSFKMVARESGEFTLRWTDDKGAVHSETATLTVG